MKTVTIKQGGMFPATPDAVYQALMDSKQHASFTGAAAKIDPKVGGAFSVWDGYATGKNVELVPGKKIVQTWRANDWPTGHQSTVKILLARTPKGTKLMFTHFDVPAEFADDIRQGWTDFYWKPLKDYLTA